MIIKKYIVRLIFLEKDYIQDKEKGLFVRSLFSGQIKRNYPIGEWFEKRHPRQVHRRESQMQKSINNNWHCEHTSFVSEGNQTITVGYSAAVRLSRIPFKVRKREIREKKIGRLSK
ncbi:hypothetical protein FGO68_gene17285 [Halteria grandinella]|uniref:Uncharacterized protein n=1 Tax=Halteria grandinella TaxID=5974 RepID=A0A8J8NBH9_HALGN|nr:hypothetical protein FGO68_gene17285 [Halteria grandinella]